MISTMPRSELQDRYIIGCTHRTSIILIVPRPVHNQPIALNLFSSNAIWVGLGWGQFVPVEIALSRRNIG